jgi:hypothetical protein
MARRWLPALLLAAALGGCDSAPEPAAPASPPAPGPVATSGPRIAPRGAATASEDAAAAIAVLRDYYAAIDARDYPRAWHLWSGGGQASRQTLAGFAAGFADTRTVSVEPGAPGRIEGAAGSRYLTVPATVRAVHADGSIHRYSGSYTLRRAVVDGATAEQRAWRIASADLREVAPDQSSKR